MAKTRSQVAWMAASTPSAIAVDLAGNAYITGQTSASNFPTTSGAYKTSFAGGYSTGFVTKLNATGSALLYSTYFGIGTTQPNAKAVPRGWRTAVLTIRATSGHQLAPRK